MRQKKDSNEGSSTGKTWARAGLQVVSAPEIPYPPFKDKGVLPDSAKQIRWIQESSFFFVGYVLEKERGAGDSRA